MRGRNMLTHEALAKYPHWTRGGKPYQRGQLEIPWVDPNTPGQIYRGVLKGYVYQGTSQMFANDPTQLDPHRQRRTQPKPNDPQTAPQLARREIFKIAVLTWQSLSPEARAAVHRARMMAPYSSPNAWRTSWYSDYHFYLSVILNAN